MSNDSIIIKPITVVRGGDLSRKSIVRISTSDGTAIAGRDYKSKTETITFEPGVSALDFDIKILYKLEDERKTLDFKVYLGPQDPVSAVFGKIKSSKVFIKDSISETNNLESQNSAPYDNSDRLASSPYLMSIRDFPVNDVVKDFLAEPQKMTLASSAYPLICIHVR